ncbi:MAG: hypothetical protein JSS02_20780 [Planctomycetes bacterium]|nr:hypothetical protein [Planctomycetota bacterium]
MLFRTIFSQVSSRSLGLCLSGVLLLAGIGGCKSAQSTSAAPQERSAQRAAPLRLATKPSLDFDRDDEDSDDDEEYPDFRGRRSDISVPGNKHIASVPEVELLPAPGVADRAVNASASVTPASVTDSADGNVLPAAPQKVSRLRSLLGGSSSHRPVPVANPPRLSSTPFTTVTDSTNVESPE